MHKPLFYLLPLMKKGREVAKNYASMILRIGLGLAQRNLPNVDFAKLTALVKKVEEKSSWIGAEHVRLSCSELIQSCYETNKNIFFRALTWMKNEFLKTQDKLDTIAQMELRIIRLKNKQLKK